VKVVKNKMAPPFREVEFDIMYGEGISHEGDLVDLGAESGVVEKSGAWFGFEGDRIGQGRDNARTYLKEHPEVARKIEGKVLAHHGVRREVGAPSLAAGSTNGHGNAHAFAPVAKPVSEKRGR
jgi:recombination protein RecA